MNSEKLKLTGDNFKKIKLLSEHLMACTQCQCKVVSNLTSMQNQLENIFNHVHDCRSVAKSILEKRQKTSKKNENFSQYPRIVKTRFDNQTRFEIFKKVRKKMQNNWLRDKGMQITVKNPFRVLASCGEDEDYDTCGSNEDFNDKDLALLLKEEAAKLQKLNNFSEKKIEKLTNKKSETQNYKYISHEASEKSSVEISLPEQQTPDIPSKEKKKIHKKLIKNPFSSSKSKMSNIKLIAPSSSPPSSLPKDVLLLDVKSSNKMKTKSKKLGVKKKFFDTHFLSRQKKNVILKSNIDEDKGNEGDIEDEMDDETECLNKKKGKKT